jgi:hypothetical protein
VLNRTDYAPKIAFRPSIFLTKKMLSKIEKKSENLEFYGNISRSLDSPRGKPAGKRRTTIPDADYLRLK